MKPHRLEAFSDGVIAIIITIMVLELKAPHETTLEALFTLWPVFFSYVLSFLLVAIYWVNHHHLLHLVHKVDGVTLWANMHLLFWMSLIPFVTAYMGETHGTELSVFMYGAVQLACATGYFFLRLAIGRHHKDNAEFVAFNRRMLRKVNIAQACYVASVVMAFVAIPISLTLMVLPALIYFMPEKDIEECVERH